MKNHELLAPAGDLGKLKTAFAFGADSVYLAGVNFGMRAASANFTNDQILQALEFAHNLNKKVYIRNLLLEINRKIPLDILVYSKEELNILKNYGNNFIDEIEKTGKIIYEKAS